MPKYKKAKVAHYFKQDFPDQRFLPFRQYLHNKTAKDALPDLTFFQRMYNEKPAKTNRKSRISPERNNQIFKSKEKIYREMFTNGQVDIRSDFQIELEKTQTKTFLKGKAEERMNALVRKGRFDSRKKNPLDMFVDPEKKRRAVSERKIASRV
jgi:hypothetical protein